jgi:DNA gyrase/topoisomerase IV subunit B
MKPRRKLTESFRHPGVQTASVQEHIRKRPGMYFGAAGPDGFPTFFLGLIEGILRQAPEDYRGPIEVEVSQTDDGQTLHAWFRDLKLSAFPAAAPDEWLEGMRKSQCYGLDFVPAACSRCSLIISDGRRKGTLRWRNGYPGKSKVSVASDLPGLTFKLEPDPSIFGMPGPEHHYKMAGMLRDFCILRPGLAVTLRSGLLGNEIRYFYKAGMESFLMEEDYQRWPLHKGCLAFNASEGDMRVACRLRFVHAGSAQVRSYANYHPTQGGSHLEGLGDALVELFGREARGCREVLFVTNPDKGKKVFLPHSCMGVLQVRLERPQYAGPTKDILCNTEVYDFVFRAAKSGLKEQWDNFEGS